MTNFILTPSLYCADLLNLTTEITKLQASGINHFHYDVMDGHFVNNYAFGPMILSEIKKYFPKIVIDLHFMGYNLLTKIDLFLSADYLTFHWQSVKNAEELEILIQALRTKQIRIGIALDLNDEFSVLEEYFMKINVITIMTIKPGFMGQSFDPIAWNKLKQIKTLKEKYPHLIFQVDGGVRWDNIQQIIDYGVDWIVVGSLLFTNKDYPTIIKKIKSAI